MNNVIIKCGTEDIYFSVDLKNIDFSSKNYRNTRNFKGLIDTLNKSYKMYKTKFMN